MNPEGSTAHTSRLLAGAETTQFYHHNEAHQQAFHTPSPYRTMPYGASSYDNMGRHDIDNFSTILESVNNTLSNIQKKLSALEERHTNTESALKDIQNAFDEIKQDGCKGLQKSTSRKSPSGLSVCN